MNTRNISEIIFRYLQEFADAPYNKYPNPSSSIVEVLRKNPSESFQVIANGLFQKPENLDFRDMDNPLCRLLITFADLVPELLIQKMTAGFWAARYLYISSAAACKAPVFIPVIINLLTDRSMYIKTLVLDLVITYPHLQIPEAMPKLEKLSKMKSFQNSEMDRKLLEKATQCVHSNLRIVS